MSRRALSLRAGHAICAIIGCLLAAAFAIVLTLQTHTPNSEPQSNTTIMTRK